MSNENDISLSTQVSTAVKQPVSVKKNSSPPSDPSQSSSEPQVNNRVQQTDAALKETGTQIASLNTKEKSPVIKKQEDVPVYENAAQIKKKLKEVIPKVMEIMNKNQRSVEFEVSEIDKKVVITVRDKENDKVIRQIPGEEFVKLQERLAEGASDEVAGRVLDTKV